MSGLASPAPGPGRTGGSRSTRRLLLADADRSLRGVLERVLAAHGYQVDVAINRLAALDMAARHHPNLIVLDLSLPGVVEVVRELRSRDTTPILLLSAWGTETDRQAALDAGADDYLTKPFGIGELLALVRAALRRPAPSEEHTAITTEHTSPSTWPAAESSPQPARSTSPHRVAPSRGADAQPGPAGA
jgi:two-component system KDP operon response regulator KdpE